MKRSEVDLLVLVTVSMCVGINLAGILRSPDVFSVVGLILTLISTVIFCGRVLRYLE